MAQLTIPRRVKEIRIEKLVPMFCPDCGTRYLKDKIPGMDLYICIWCFSVGKDEVALKQEETKKE